MNRRGDYREHIIIEFELYRVNNSEVRSSGEGLDGEEV